MTSHDIATILIESGNFEGQLIEDSKMQSFCVLGDSRYPNNLPSLKLTCSPLKKSRIPKAKETIVFQPSSFRCFDALLVFGRVHHSKPCPKNHQPARNTIKVWNEFLSTTGTWIFFNPEKIGDSPNLEIIFHPPEKLRFGTPTKMEIWLEDDVPDFQIWGSSGAFAVSFRKSTVHHSKPCPKNHQPARNTIKVWNEFLSTTGTWIFFNP